MYAPARQGMDESTGLRDQARTRVRKPVHLFKAEVTITLSRHGVDRFRQGARRNHVPISG
jgi:hypothetical protein